MTSPIVFEMRVAVIAPGGEQPYREVDWHDALVIVESGEIELECLGGSRERFEAGDTLSLAGLPLRALHNRGDEPALLVAVSRSP